MIRESRPPASRSSVRNARSRSRCIGRRRTAPKTRAGRQCLSRVRPEGNRPGQNCPRRVPPSRRSPGAGDPFRSPARVRPRRPVQRRPLCYPISIRLRHRGPSRFLVSMSPSARRSTSGRVLPPRPLPGKARMPCRCRDSTARAPHRPRRRRTTPSRRSTSTIRPAAARRHRLLPSRRAGMTRSPPTFRRFPHRPLHRAPRSRRRR